MITLTKEDLRIPILSLLLHMDEEMAPKDIERELWDTIDREKFSRNRGSFHVQLHRALESLKDDDLLKRRDLHPEALSPRTKGTRYSIKDKDLVRFFVTTSKIGLNLLKKRKSWKMSTDLKAKNYQDLAESLSKILLSVILQRKDFTDFSFSAHPRFPVPMIIGFKEKDNILRDKILIIVPDEASSAKIRAFTEEQYGDLVGYLTSAWRVYFEEFRIAHGSIALVHFSKEQAQRLTKIVELGEAKSLDEIVHLATSKYLDLHDKSERPFLIKTGSITKMAVNEGIYKDLGEAIDDAIKRNEERLIEEEILHIE